MGYYKTNRDFHEARWDEPIIMKLGNPGERGVLVPKADEKVTKATGTVKTLLPKNLIRKKAPKLPEMSQMQVLRHYMRLSQETIGTDFNIDIGLGTCTMKYSPKIHEQLVRSEKLSEVHPYQDESTIQGILEIMYRDEQYIKAISGMDKVSLQPGGGTQAIFANVETIRAYHESRGEGEQRNEIITTILSHPGNPGAAATLGYKVITLYPDENGVPDIEALKAAVSEHTAALMITNPEDTGIYNEKIKEFVDIVHAAGGLCVYDQANLNGLFGITRARDAGFDMCHYNLHKSFSSPHGCQGPAAGAQCVCEKLAKFVAAPTVEFDGEKVYLVDGDRSVSLADIAVKSQVNNRIPVDVTATYSSPVSPPPYMVGMAEIELDKETGSVKILDYDAVVDCGIPVNPNLARVQTEGGIGQGIGMALYENVTYNANGKITEGDFMQYKIPTRQDVGNIHVEFETSYEPSGPFGVKSIGEIVINTPAPALAHAIYRATGVWHRTVPFTPEKILMGMLDPDWKETDHRVKD